MKTTPNDLMHSFNHTPDTEGNFNGLTKREYFAAIMLQGLVTLSSHQQSHESHATQAIAYADALINALNR
jgi:hypothetical protein